MSEPKKMTPEDAARIQSHADKSGTNQDFKARAQSAADKNAAQKGQQDGGQQPGKK